MKPDEVYLLVTLAYVQTSRKPLSFSDLLAPSYFSEQKLFIHFREVIQGLSESGRINGKRALFLLEKWTRQGYYDYGVSLDLGWLTPLGLEKAAAVEPPEFEFSLE